jgi:hypothetical protein
MSIALNSQERAILREAQKAWRHDNRIYIRITVLLMLDQGFSAQQIGGALGTVP